MARSDLITTLIKASAQGDQGLLKRTVDALAAEEHAKRHHLFADKIVSAYESGLRENAFRQSRHASALTATRLSANNDEIADLLHELHPTRGLGSLYLAPPILRSCAELVEEQIRADLLRSHATEPRNRMLLAGPPGNGKTSLAQAIAFELGLPLFVLKYEGVIGSYLGETSTRLKRVFEYVRSRPCVVFFDEFDTLGKERGDIHETGEIKRVVSALLLQIDDLPTYNVIIAATNHGELIDRAAWRRFQIRLELVAPTIQQLSEMIVDFMRTLPTSHKVSIDSLARALYGLSYAEAEQFLLDVRRRTILDGELETVEAIIGARLMHLERRYTIKADLKNDGDSPLSDTSKSKPSNKGKRQSEIF